MTLAKLQRPPAALHCSSGFSSFQLRQCFINSGEASMELRGGSIAARAALHQLRRSFNGAPRRLHHSPGGAPLQLPRRDKASRATPTRAAEPPPCVLRCITGGERRPTPAFVLRCNRAARAAQPLLPCAALQRRRAPRRSTGIDERRIATPAAPSSRSAGSNQVNNEAALQHRLFRQQKSPRHNAVDLEQQHVKLEKQTMVDRKSVV